jgi:hypothetical protein
MRVLPPFLVLACLLPAAAQDLSQWSNTSRLQPGQKIEIIHMDLKRVRGDFLHAGPNEIRIAISGAESAIPRQKVFRISSLEKSKRLRNALLGAAIGAAAGLAVGAATDASFSEDDEHIAKSLFTPIGAGPGVALGSAFAGFETIYRAPARTTP